VGQNGFNEPCRMCRHSKSLLPLRLMAPLRRGGGGGGSTFGDMNPECGAPFRISPVYPNKGSCAVFEPARSVVIYGGSCTPHSVINVIGSLAELEASIYIYIYIR
jgi:hypothetical protein